MKADLRKRLAELSQPPGGARLSRRQFLRSTTLLGLTLGVSELLAACGLQPRKPTSGYVPYLHDIVPSPIGGELFPPTYTPGPSPTPAPTQTPAPAPIYTWLCDTCGQHFPNRDALQRHFTATHTRRLPEIRRVEQPTYSEFLVGKVERFDERNTVFSRTMWDEALQAQVAEAMARAPKDDWERFEGRARVAGAIYVDDTAGTLHPNYYGYYGHVNGDAGLYGWDDPVNPTQMPVDDPAQMSALVKAAARLYGADLVGITKIDPRWVYSHFFERSTGNYGELTISYKYAIVMGIEMDWQGINTSPEPYASAATALAYSRMSELASSLAKYIRALGYPAIPCGNDSMQSIPLAIDAGLGELGRNGLLLSPEYGPRQRICKVLTNLPLEIDQPIDFGMRSYCEKCHACASACPVDAILRGDRTSEPTSISNRQGILRWPVNVSRCFLFWRENGVDCSNCIAACPWALQNPRDWLEIESL